MPNVILKFEKPLQSGLPSNFVFGAGPDIPSGDTYVATLSGTFKRTTASITAGFDNAVFRGPSSGFNSSWGVTEAKAVHVSHVEQTPEKLRVFNTSGIENGEPIVSQADLNFDNAVPTKSAIDAAWEDAIPVEASVGDAFGTLYKLHLKNGAVWQDGIPLGIVRQGVFYQLSTRARPTKRNRWQEALARGRVTTSKAGVGKPRGTVMKSLWDVSTRPAPGMYVRPPIPPNPDGYQPQNGRQVNFLFKDARRTSNDLIFGMVTYVPAKKLIPVRRTYTVINTVDLRRVDDNQQLNVLSMDMSIDMDSWTWGFNASLLADQRSLVLPSVPGEPVVVQAAINGENFRFLIESVRRSRSFGKDAITISGRGLSATLAEPYSENLFFSNDQERTAQQLMNDALTINGVPLGWSVDWQVDDWIVPAGVWSHQGSYMSAVTAIAQSVGAFVQPDPVAKLLKIKPRNRVKPWELSTATADIDIPDSAVITEEETWEDRAQFDSVYVSGTKVGSILGLVKRTGSAGDKPAPMVTDALITTATAARQRGIYELSKYGPIVNRSLSLPVLSESGIILPGDIAKYTADGIPNTGVVNSVRVTVSLPTVRQQISITSHV